MESTEFDSTVGGSEHLPYSANIFKFAASRSVEIAAMTESVMRPSKTKLIFQNLPVHMRRRVMSHNSKRLPKKLRDGHLEQMSKSGFAPKQKRPSRKYRRRATNLLKEYNRRKRRHIWLETHIWHAKRFHMTDRWGHRLAYSPCDKAFRACYRATSAHCLLQDISYYTPIRIHGLSDDIKSIFNSITSKVTGLSVSAMAYSSGNREGSLHLYKPNMYPFGYIGKIQFIWVQTETDSKDLWLFVHPSQTNIVESILNKVVQDLTCGNTEYFTCTEPKRKKLDSKYLGKIKIETMGGALNRFRLTGPRSQAVLLKCLKCVYDYNNVSHTDWIAHCNKIDSQLYFKEKFNYWQSLGKAHSSSQLPPRLILGLVVKDPRLSRPKNRTKAELSHENIETSSLLDVPVYSSVSPLWNDTVRETIKCNAITNPQFVEHITQSQLIPGEVNEDDPALQSIPIILVQRPGSQNSEYKKLGFGSGWDIIIPAGYGLPFWLTFIMFGARSGGLREFENLCFESGECYLPPDSDTGNAEEIRIEEKLKEQYFKRPPSKRVNFIKYGISSPFCCPWKILLRDWCVNDIDDFFVLRDKFLIKEIEECLSSKKKLETIENADHCLIAIYLQLSGKGNLRNNALICMPKSEDTICMKTLSEPQHDDINFKLRKSARLEHRRTLRQRKRHTKLQKEFKKASSDGKPRVNSEPSAYVKQMRELWLPGDLNTVRFLGMRETMGFISKAAYSYSEAKSCGVGYIAFNALQKLLNNGYKQVLVRNTTTLKYRLAKLQIIKDL